MLREPAISPAISRDAPYMHRQPHAKNVNTVLLEFYVDYVKNGNVCTYAPPADNSDCCKTFLPSGECTECAAGLVLAEGKCTDRKIVGCLVRSKTGSCLNCALEYTLFGGQCIKKITGCTKVTSTGAC